MSKSAKRMVIALTFAICFWCGDTKEAWADSTYPHSQDGFRSQLDALKQAYCSDDKPEAKSLREQFKIPDAKSWFEQRFDPDTAAQLEDRYEKLFSNYSNWMTKSLMWACMVEGSFSVTPSSEVNTQPNSDDNKASNIRPPAEVVTDQFGFELTEPVDSVKWIETFTYIDGAFRFLGIGATPFWTWEEDADTRLPKIHIEPRAPQLVRQIQPNYPEKAFKKHIAGDVVVLATVDGAGNVTDVKVVSGDPLLLDSAVGAIKQWKFKPMIIGGKPSRFRVRIGVTFHKEPRPN
jgi:TonB family protein